MAKTLPALTYPDRLEGSYRRILLNYTKDMRDTVENAVLKDPLVTTRTDSLVSDFIGLLRTLKDKFRAAWSDARLQRVTTEVFDENVAYNRRQAKQKWGKVLPVEPFDGTWQANERDAFVRQNVALIRSIDERYFKEIEDLVLNNVRTGELTRDLAKKIEERYGVSRSRASLIARDQNAKLVGQLTKKRQIDAGVEYAIWSTSQDERVRPSHRRVNGKKFDIEEGIVVDGVRTFPGQPIQCRCNALPFLPDLDD